MSAADPAQRSGPRRRRRYRLGTLLLLVNLVILAMPLLGIWTARVYENELVRRTEADLLGQSALFEAAAIEAFEAQGLLNGEGSHSHGLSPDLAGVTRGNPDMGLGAGWADLNRIEVHLPTSPSLKAAETLDAPAGKVADHLQALVERVHRSTNTRVDLLDHQGRSMASTRWARGAHLSHVEEASRALRGEHLRLLRQCAPGPEADPYCDEVRLVVATPIVSGGRVYGAILASRSPLSVWLGLMANLRVILVFIGVLVVAVVAQTWFISRAIVKPVDELTNQAESLARGEREAVQVIEDPVTFEVERLSGAVVHMAQSLDARARYIQDFASNVSHEFKTPLASIRGAVELLEDHFASMDDAERERFLGMVDRHAERLERLVGRLLELARADVFQPGASVEASVVESLQTLVGRYADAHIELEIEEGLGTEVSVRMAAVTFDSIVGNLIDNALQHGGGSVDLRICASIHDGRVNVEVIDEGPGVSEANRGRIFDPFFTTARDEGGTGLGLAVIASLLLAHSGHIELLEGQPTTFRVSLPVTSSEAA